MSIQFFFNFCRYLRGCLSRNSQFCMQNNQFEYTKGQERLVVRVLPEIQALASCIINSDFFLVYSTMSIEISRPFCSQPGQRLYNQSLKNKTDLVSYNSKNCKISQLHVSYNNNDNDND